MAFPYDRIAGSVRHQVHDGDTIKMRARGNLGIRFPGVDVPETSFMFPGEGFAPLYNPKWDNYLSDVHILDTFNPPLSADLKDRMSAGLAPGLRTNQRHSADIAEDILEDEIMEDMQAQGRTEMDFRFFLIFSHEIMNRYGRFLYYINRFQQSGPRPLAYNERLPEKAAMDPYLIWPNIKPFRRAESIAKAVIPPGKAKVTTEKDSARKEMRKWVRDT